MLKNLSRDFQLRGYSFEYIAKVILRRHNKNNFIFQACLFDSLTELITKYKLNIPQQLKGIIEFANLFWNKFDLIEFCLDDTNNRNIRNVEFYEIKTKYFKVNRDYYEFCKSNYNFSIELLNKFNKRIKIISIILFEDWRFSINIYDFDENKIRVYSNFKK